MHLRKATRYLKDVKAKKQIVPFRKYHGGVGRKAQVSMCVCVCMRMNIHTKHNCELVLLVRCVGTDICTAVGTSGQLSSVDVCCLVSYPCRPRTTMLLAPKGAGRARVLKYSCSS